MKKIVKKIWLPIKEVLKKIRDFLYRNPITEHVIKVKDQILLESKPDFSDNTYALYQEMLKHNYQDKYQIIWLVTTDEIPEVNQNPKIKYFNVNKKGPINKLKFQYLLNSSKYIITCNRVFKRKTNRQTIIYLNHGSPLKDLKKLKMNYSTVSESITMSKYFVPEDSKNMNIDPTKFYINGFPRNDDLLTTNNKIKKVFNINKEKIIVWLPTFRVYEDAKRIDSDFQMPLGVPIIYNEVELKKLNDYLVKNNVVIILKPHFAANINNIKIQKLSNFIITNNSFLNQNGISLYSLLGVSDALITDYSSVYYDYLIKNKPIALTLDDYENYKKNTGFLYDYKSIIKGYYIYDKKDLYSFIDEIKESLDTCKKSREETIKLLNLDTKGNYSKKLFKHLVDKYHF